jgi:2-oxoglutarate/2-oxoacid ferredoxin oxidoreductase subunit alpha
LYGPPTGDVLLIGWGSVRGSIQEAVDRARADGAQVSAAHLRYLMPLQPGLKELMAGFKHVFVVELNDEGMYGYGQLAGILRASFCDPRIQGINKTDGLTFKVREILQIMREKTQAAPVAAGA